MREERSFGAGSLVLLAGLAVLGFFAFKLLPPYMDDLEVERAIRGLLGIAWNMSDAAVRADLHQRLAVIGSHTGVDGAGQPRGQPGLLIPDEDILLERNPQADTIRIEATYERTVDMRPWNKTITLHFHPVVQAPLMPTTSY